VPTYNVADTVRKTLNSILSQTYPNFVVNIVDNASADETISVVQSIVDSRIIIHKNEVNVGGEGNFTRCIQMATGKYTAIFHADDIYEPEMIAKQVSYLEGNSAVGAVFTAALTIDEIGAVTGIIGKVPKQRAAVVQLEFQQLLKDMLQHHNFLVCPSAMVRTEIYRDSIKTWGNNTFRSASDIDMWLRLANIKPIAVLNEPLMRYRISQAQFSNRIRNRVERTDFFSVMDTYLARPEVRSFLTAKDFKHYQRLERHDLVARCLNLFKFGRLDEAKMLLKDVFSKDALLAAAASRRGLVTLGAAIMLYILINFSPNTRWAAIVNILKKTPWR
jgi:glycosyltransferase involved in cell wall biosynthesis